MSAIAGVTHCMARGSFLDVQLELGRVCRNPSCRKYVPHSAGWVPVCRFGGLLGFDRTPGCHGQVQEGADHFHRCANHAHLSNGSRFGRGE